MAPLLEATTLLIPHVLHAALLKKDGTVSHVLHHDRDILTTSCEHGVSVQYL